MISSGLKQLNIPQILEKSDYTMISGNPFIKKTGISLDLGHWFLLLSFKLHEQYQICAGWRKISFYFNLSYEIKDKTIEFDENRNVLRAEFIVRAHMQYVLLVRQLFLSKCVAMLDLLPILCFVHRGGRFSDGWGSCERREKKFLKPNHDIPSTAETRAKNKACQVHRFP